MLEAVARKRVWSYRTEEYTLAMRGRRIVGSTMNSIDERARDC